MRKLYHNDIVKAAKPIDKIIMPGVYFLINKELIVYIGSSFCPHARINTHITEKRKDFDKTHIIFCKSIDKAVELERHYIKTIKPMYNISFNTEYNKPEPIAIDNEVIIIEEPIKLPEPLPIEQTPHNGKTILPDTFVKKSDGYIFNIAGKKLFISHQNQPFTYNNKDYLFTGTMGSCNNHKIAR